MKLLGLLTLEEFKRNHADSRDALDAWRYEVEQSQWDGPHDIKSRYASASILPNDIVIFNIKGNKYRLVIKVKYRNGISEIRWVGTHAEYDKKSFT